MCGGGGFVGEHNYGGVCDNCGGQQVVFRSRWFDCPLWVGPLLSKIRNRKSGLKSSEPEPH